MAEHDQEQAVNETPDTPAAAAASPEPGSPSAPAPAEKGFVPFFNEEYEFKLGSLGEMGAAYRLAAIFVFMLIAAAMMYVASVWWVERHKPEAAASPDPTPVVSPTTAPTTSTASTEARD